MVELKNNESDLRVYQQEKLAKVNKIDVSVFIKLS